MEKARSQSYSMITAAYTCLRKYKLRFIDEIEPDIPRSSALEFGTCMHAAIQAALEGGDAADVFRIYWDSVKDKDMKYYRQNWDELNDVGQTLLSRFQRLHAKHFEIKYPMEERLYADLYNYPVEGTPDFVGKYKGVDSIVDFKTSSQPYVKEKIVSNEQMHLYAYLALKKYGYAAKQLVYIVFVKNPARIQVLTHPLTTQNNVYMLQNIKSMCEELDKRTNWPQNKNSCLMSGRYKCDYWDICYGHDKHANTRAAKEGE